MTGVVYGHVHHCGGVKSQGGAERYAYTWSPLIYSWKNLVEKRLMVWLPLIMSSLLERRPRKSQYWAGCAATGWMKTYHNRKNNGGVMNIQSMSVSIGIYYASYQQSWGMRYTCGQAIGTPFMSLLLLIPTAPQEVCSCARLCSPPADAAGQKSPWPGQVRETTA